MNSTMTQNGVSTINQPKNTESYESFNRKRRTYIQYDYRHSDGTFFSCVKPTLHECRGQRDKWLLKQPVLPENELSWSKAVDLFESGELVLIIEQGGLNRKSINCQAKVADFFHMPAKEVVLWDVIRNLLDYREYKIYKI